MALEIFGAGGAVSRAVPGWLTAFQSAFDAAQFDPFGHAEIPASVTSIEPLRYKHLYCFTAIFRAVLQFMWSLERSERRLLPKEEAAQPLRFAFAATGKPFSAPGP